MAPKARATPSRALEGEDLKTSHWEDARHWMSIYANLLEFKRGILDRVRKDVASLQPLARMAAEADVQIIEDQMQGYQARLDLWYRRIWELHGLWPDPEDRMIRHQGREVALTLREFQLLQFLLDHPTATSPQARSLRYGCNQQFRRPTYSLGAAPAQVVLKPVDPIPAGSP